MAQVKFFAGWNLNELGFHFYDERYNGDEIIQDFNGSWTSAGFTSAVYADFAYVYGLNTQGVGWALGPAGANLAYDDVYPSGIASALSEWSDGGTDTYTMKWVIEGVSFSISDLIDAILTPTQSDDLLLLASILSGDDTAELSAFDDEFNGYAGRDLIKGGDGNDVIYGDRGLDRLYGGRGDDDLFGGSGNDKLYGEANKDYLNGGYGNDTLEGGNGIDWQWGGPGNDTFVYRRIGDAPAGGPEYDSIGDFAPGSDKISLLVIDANTAGSAAGNQAFTFVGTAAFDGQAGRLRYDVIDVDSDGDDDVLVLGTVNADTTADFAIAVLNRTSIASTDFIL